MTQEQIIEGNKLIAEFMGACNKQTAPCIIKAYVQDDEVWFHVEIEPTKEKRASYKLAELLYHSSWDWLMDVVEKISKWADTNEYKYNQYFWKVPHRTDFTIFRMEKDELWLSVVEFIKWYNANSDNGKKE